MEDSSDVLVQIRPDDARPIYVQIVDEIRRAVVVGSLAPDESLPSVRELASRLQVNPNTVSRAYRELERQGVVYVQRGRGTFVADGGTGEDRRKELAGQVARRALREAHRHSLSAPELLRAIRRVADEDRPTDASEPRKAEEGE